MSEGWGTVGELDNGWLFESRSGWLALKTKYCSDDGWECYLLDSGERCVLPDKVECRPVDVRALLDGQVSRPDPTPPDEPKRIIPPDEPRRFAVASYRQGTRHAVPPGARQDDTLHGLQTACGLQILHSGNWQELPALYGQQVAITCKNCLSALRRKDIIK